MKRLFHIALFSIIVCKSAFTQIFTNNAAGLVFNGNVALVLNNTSFENKGAIHNGTESIYVLGTTAPHFSGSNTISFYNLLLNNAGGLTINKCTSVNHLLSLTNGKIQTVTGKHIIVNSGATISGGSSSSFISGPVERTGSVDFTFPIGKGTVYSPVTISDLSGSETFTAEYFNHSPSDDGYSSEVKVSELKHVSTLEYFTLSRIGSVSANITIPWSQPASGTITDYANLTLSHWTGSLWEVISSVPSGTNATGTIISTSRVSSFSPFALGSLTYNNTLPISLKQITATCANKNVSLNWETASETNNDRFDVEYSKDGEHFLQILTMKGAGNSTQSMHYNQNIKQSEELGYYRLKQVDFDDKSSYSDIVSAKCSDVNYKDVWCTSNNDFFSLYYVCPSASRVGIEVVDFEGKVVFQVFQDTSKGINEIDFPLDDLSAGIYFVNIQKNGQTLSRQCLHKQ